MLRDFEFKLNSTHQRAHGMQTRSAVGLHIHGLNRNEGDTGGHPHAGQACTGWQEVLALPVCAGGSSGLPQDPHLGEGSPET